MRMTIINTQKMALYISVTWTNMCRHVDCSSEVQTRYSASEKGMARPALYCEFTPSERVDFLFSSLSFSLFTNCFASSALYSYFSLCSSSSSCSSIFCFSSFFLFFFFLFLTNVSIVLQKDDRKNRMPARHLAVSGRG